MWFFPANLAPLEQNLPFARRKGPGNAVEERRFPSTVGTDDADDLVFLNGQADIVNRYQPSESFENIFDFQ